MRLCRSLCASSCSGARTDPPPCVSLSLSRVRRYGLLRADDAPKLIDLALAPSSSTEPWYARWRGRLGLSPSAVRAAYAARPEGAAVAGSKADEPRSELGDRVELGFRTFEGEEIMVAGYEGESVMVRLLLPLPPCPSLPRARPLFFELSLIHPTPSRRKPPGVTRSPRSSPRAAATASARRATSTSPRVPRSPT